MAYREDPDLKFLGEIESKDLDVLVQYLTKDKDGDSRWTEQLTKTKEYKTYAPNHRIYWKLIAAELQKFGGNTIANFFRGNMKDGEGVLYREILKDVCERMDAAYKNSASIEENEKSLLLKVFEKTVQKMSEEELREIAKEMDLKVVQYTPEAMVVALQGAVSVSSVVAYKLAWNIANAVAKVILGSGLAFATRATVQRVLGFFAGPVGWLLTGIWTAVDIAGPAYRITVPAVIQIAYLRQEYNNKTYC